MVASQTLPPRPFMLYTMDAESPSSSPYTLTIEVEVDPNAIDEFLRHCTAFFADPSGGWAYGVPCAGSNTWLVYEQSDGRPSEISVARAERCHKTGKRLHAGWHTLDWDAAVRAWCEGARRWGRDWYDSNDAGRYGIVLQIALLGELRYVG